MRGNLFILLLGILFTCLPSCEQWPIEDEITNTADNAITPESPNVTMSPVTAADYGGTLPVVSILAPDAGEPIKAEDLRSAEAALLAECDDIRNNGVSGLANKVDKTGDTMTSTLTITPDTAVPALVLNAATNTGAASITGDGTAAAVTVVAGSSNGAIVTQSNNSSYTIDILNAGTGGGLQVQGSVGSTTPALNVSVGTAPSATVPKYGIQVLGSITYTGTPPNADVDVGIDGFVARQNIVTSSGVARSLGGNTFDIQGNSGFNIDSFSGNASGVATITFARNLPGNNYRIHIFPEDGYDARWNGVRNVGNFQFVVRDQATNAVVDLTTTAISFAVSTIGY